MSIQTVIAFSCVIFIAGIIIALGIFFGLRARLSKESDNPVGTHSQKYQAKEVIHEVYPNGNVAVSSISNVEGLKHLMSDDNGEGFETIMVDDIEYIIYEELKTIDFYNKNGTQRLMQVKVDGYGNRQREINWIRVFMKGAPKEGYRFFVKHNAQDRQAFKKLLDEHLYGGELQEVALKFQDTCVEMARFNELIVSGKVRKRNGRYYQMY
jgi:hypothetical protein